MRKTYVLLLSMILAMGLNIHAQSLYIIGEVNGNGWDPEVGESMTQTGNGIYTAKVTVNGFFGLCTELGDWDTVAAHRLFPADGVQLITLENGSGVKGLSTVKVGNDAFTFGAEVLATLTVDLNAMTLTVNTEQEVQLDSRLYLVGAFSDWKFDESNLMTETITGVYEIENVKIKGEFKLACPGFEPLNFGAATLQSNPSINQPFSVVNSATSYNMLINADADSIFNVNVKLDTNSYYLTVTEAAVQPDPEPEPDPSIDVSALAGTYIGFSSSMFMPVGTGSSVTEVVNVSVEDNEIYFDGICGWSSDNQYDFITDFKSIKGTVKGSKIVIPLGQVVGKYSNIALKLGTWDANNEKPVFEGEISVNIKDGSLSFSNSIIIYYESYGFYEFYDGYWMVRPNAEVKYKMSSDIQNIAEGEEVTIPVYAEYSSQGGSDYLTISSPIKMRNVYEIQWELKDGYATPCSPALFHYINDYPYNYSLAGAAYDSIGERVIYPYKEVPLLAKINSARTQLTWPECNGSEGISDDGIAASCWTIRYDTSDLPFYASQAMLTFYDYEEEKIDYEYSVEDMLLSPTETNMIPVAMNNKGEVTSFQCDIILPEGLSLDTNEYGDYNIVKGERLDNSFVVASADYNDKVRVLIYSSSNHMVTDSVGVVFYLPVKVADGLTEGTKLPISITGGSVTLLPNFDEILVADVTAEMTVGAAYHIGDVNDDGRISAADVSMAVSYVLGGDPANAKFKAADANKDGRISAADVSIIVSFVLSGQTVNAPSFCKSAKSGNQIFESTYIDTKDNGILSIEVSNIQNYIAAQMDVTVPVGVGVNDIRLVGDNAQDHCLAYKALNDGTIRLLVYSLSNKRFCGGDSFVEIELGKIGNCSLTTLEVDNVLLTECIGDVFTEKQAESVVTTIDISGIGNLQASHRTVHINGLPYIVDGDGAVVLCDLGGRIYPLDETLSTTLDPGIYLLGNKKIVIK